MDDAQNVSKHKFGLIGKNIDYSFSKGYFVEKFKTENLPHDYVNFDLQKISEFEDIFKNLENIKTFNQVLNRISSHLVFYSVKDYLQNNIRP